MSLKPIINKVLPSIMLHRLTPVREYQAGVRPRPGCINQIFTPNRILETRPTHRCPKIVVFLDLKGPFDQTDRTAPFSDLYRRGVQQQFVNLQRALCSHTYGCVKVHGELINSFETTSNVPQRLSISPILCNFLIDKVIEYLRMSSGYRRPTGKWVEAA